MGRDNDQSDHRAFQESAQGIRAHAERVSRRHMRAFAPARPDGSHHLAARLGFQRRLDPRDPAVVVYHLDLKQGLLRPAW